MLRSAPSAIVGRRLYYRRSHHCHYYHTVEGAVMTPLPGNDEVLGMFVRYNGGGDGTQSMD